MKLGLISLAGPSSREILDKSKNYFTRAKDINIKRIEAHASQQDIKILYEGKLLEQFDCIYLRGSFKYAQLQKAITLARYENTYMPLRPKSFIAHNKFSTALELQRAKIPIPTTYLAATVKGAKKLLEQINYPITMKIPYGTQGKGVMFADSIESGKSILDALEVFKQPFIIQEYIETGATDIRALVLGGEVVAAMKRKAVKYEMRANIHMGGTGVPIKLDYDTEQIAIKSAKVINADICAVDILEARKPVVIEVNLSPGIQGLKKATKKDIASIIAKFLKDKTEEFKKVEKEKDYKDIIKEIDEREKNNTIKQMLSNIDIKAGIIKVPELMTQITGFKKDEEVTFIAKKGMLVIKK